MNFQPILQDDKVLLMPLGVEDFECLYEAANDPLLWEQHPNPDRYKKEVFMNYFEGAIQSEGAFIIREKENNAVLGSSRFYQLEATGNDVYIGYTFFRRSCWGKGYNQVVKELMLQHIFQFTDKVLFQVGALNKRSQIAMERLGGIKIGEEEVAYFGESNKLNYVYQIKKSDWESKFLSVQ